MSVWLRSTASNPCIIAILDGELVDNARRCRDLSPLLSNYRHFSKFVAGFIHSLSLG